MKKLLLALLLITTPAQAHHDGWAHFFSNADVKAVNISPNTDLITFWFRYTEFDPIVYQKVFLRCSTQTYTVQSESGEVVIDLLSITPSMSMWSLYEFICLGEQ